MPENLCQIFYARIYERNGVLQESCELKQEFTNPAYFLHVFLIFVRENFVRDFMHILYDNGINIFIIPLWPEPVMYKNSSLMTGL